MSKNMAIPSDNETWVIEIGDAVIRKEAQSGSHTLLPWEKLVHSAELDRLHRFFGGSNENTASDDCDS
jgi:hypothetical protein